MYIASTILPFFILISLGWVARERRFMPDEFLEPANQLTFYFAIPAMILNSVSHSSLDKEFHPDVLLMTLVSAALIYALVWVGCKVAKVPKELAGTLVQCCGHGNLGYIGLPFAYYFLGESGLAKTAILVSFMVILQNILSVSVLQQPDSDETFTDKIIHILKGVATNPVIISSMTGIMLSGFKIPLPLIIQRTLEILGGMASPLALLLIGASLSFGTIRKYARLISVAVIAKLVLLPTIGLLIYTGFGLPPTSYLPGLILLSCPTATIAYVMARAMGSDYHFSIAAISTSTIASALTLSFWMYFVLGSGMP